MRKKVLDILLPILSILLILIIWSITSLIVNNGYILPSVSETVKSFLELFKSGDFYLALFSTLLRSVISFFISFILAFCFAYLSNKSKGFAKFFEPVLAIIRTLPTIAVVLLILVWTNDKTAPVVVAFLVVFPTVYTEIYNSFLGIDKKVIEMCKVFNVKEKDVLFKVKVPKVLPQMILSASNCLSLNLKLMVAAEVISFTSNSIGNYLYLSKQYDEVAKMMALVLSVVILGLIISGVGKFIVKKVNKKYEC